MARATLENCPVCRRTLPDFGGWPAWCPDCGWGLEADESTTTLKQGGIAAWWRRRVTATQQAELRRLQADPSLLARRHPRSAAIVAAAIAVHLVTLALLAAGAWVMTTGIVPVLKVFAGVVAFGLVAITFPMHRLRPSTAAGRSVAPTTLTVAATVADAVGVSAPSRLRVRSYGEHDSRTSGRVLTITADRWRLLGERGRVALLAHELAHHNGRDPNRTMVVALAQETLDGWLALLRPDPRARRRRTRRASQWGRTPMAGPRTVASWSELILPIFIAPIYGTVIAIGWVLREFGVAAALRAELYADALAFKVGGDVTELIDGEIAAAIAAAAAGSSATPVPELPALERERRRRMAVAAGTGVDPIHPSYAARLEMLAVVQTQPSAQLPVSIGAADMDAMSREITGLSRPKG